MQVSAWNDGGNTYGIRVGVRNRDDHFDRSWTEIEVEIDGEPRPFALMPGFWKSCPEFRDRGAPIIREWLRRRGMLQWTKHNPPRFNLFLWEKRDFA